MRKNSAQFADDTLAFLQSLASFQNLFDTQHIYERATSKKVNAAKKDRLIL